MVLHSVDQASKLQRSLVFDAAVRHLTLFSFPDGHISGYDDVNISGNLFRVIDLEESTDKETIHLLIHLLMQFMSRSDLAYQTDEKPTCKLMAIVLKHVYLLMGFNQNDKMFQFSSARIRTSSVFNSFMANLPQFLDQNHEMGATESLFNFIVQLLIYSPYPINSIPATFEVMQNTTYSLWFLEIQVRRNWLMALLVILYKYNLSTIPEPLLSSLIRIVMNCLEAQFHQCRRIPTTIIVQDLPRRPDMPTFGLEPEERELISQSHMKSSSNLRKVHDTSLECDETESELADLVAIPESDLSDSTLHGSIDGGMSDDLPPLKSEIRKRTTNLDEIKRAPKPMAKSQSVDTTKSLSEGVRMMFSSAILSPPVNVQKAIIATQAVTRPTRSTCKDTCPGSSGMIMTNVTKTVSAVAGEKQKATVAPLNGNGGIASRRSNSPVPRALGRQQRIIDTNGIQQPSTSSLDEKKTQYTRGIDRRNFYGSPESPLSRMDILSPPETDVSTDGDTLVSPSSLRQLEIPTPERLLPIGNKDSVSSLVDRVREALSIPDISHLKSQDHLDKGDTSPPSSSRATSPRKLIKQVALLESPPSANAAETSQHKRSDPKNALNAKEEKRQTFQKVGQCQSTDSRLKYAGSWAPQAQNDDDFDEDDETSIRASYVSIETKPSSFRVGDDCINQRCSECGALKEDYTDEELGLFIVLLGTLIHREPAMAVPFLPDILILVSKVATHHTFSWQYESTTHLPGGSQSVAHQFIRCVLHQLAPNGVFYQVFVTQNPENIRKKFFKCVALALLDFVELNIASPVHLLMESLNNKKTLPVDMPIIMRNLSEYLGCLPIEALIAPIWTTAIQGIEQLFRRIIFILPSMEDAENLLSIMSSVLKMPNVPKSMLEPFSKIFSFCIQNINLTHKIVHDICCLNSRAFSKDRDKYQLARQVAFELVQSLKFKTNIPDQNLLLLVGVVLQDLGGSLPSGTVEGLPTIPPMFTNNTADCMRQYLNDVLEFLADFHTLSKIKNFKSGSQQISTGLGEDTLGGVLKGSISQYLALEMSRGNSKENRAVGRYLPWLYNAPTTLQQGPKEFTECVSHMRLLSWLLMGSLTHTALQTYRRDNIGQQHHPAHFQLQQQNTHAMAMPIQQDASCHIAGEFSNEKFSAPSLVTFLIFRPHSDDLRWICRAIEDLCAAHVLPVPCLHSLPTLDGVP